jgi:hypothetical protein
MDRDKAIAFALSQRPETIGLARLCQELLADVAGRPVTAKAPCLMPMNYGKLARPGARGLVRNPFGRNGRPA